MDRYVINLQDYPLAVCNDGTPAVFYYRRGVGDGALKWVFWFKGGGAAWSKETFRGRTRNVISSDPWMTEAYRRLGSTGNPESPDGEAGGILSPFPQENPDFFNWNHVYMVYCSSDQWSGTRPASAETGGNHFMGHYIVNAIFDTLSDSSVMGAPSLADATHILLTGSSAGAGGVRANADRLATLLNDADVRAVSDAGVFLFATPEFAAEEEILTQAQYEAWRPIVDQDCQQAHEPSGDAWHCLGGGFLVQNGYLTTPMCIHQDQSDPKIVGALDEIGLDETHLAAVAGSIRELLAGWECAFSPNFNRHILLNTDRFYRANIDGVAFSDILSNWYFGRPGPTNLIVEPK